VRTVPQVHSTYSHAQQEMMSVSLLQRILLALFHTGSSLLIFVDHLLDSSTCLRSPGPCYAVVP
jgi:hypothetical protein